ncbi:universal stress protein [Prosthecomicrobium sp. N25]|uniref:universal stress protein n=1 Tax=Prosthecomicrobium sp. N25 TaxID=3129254 RepID=UPI003076A042
MAIKDILLLLDLAKDKSPAAELALDLAGRMNAHITGVGLAIDPIVPGFVVAPIPIELIEAAREEALKTARDAAARFEHAAGLAGVSRETRIVEVLMGGAPENFLANCRTTDLVVVGQEDPDKPEGMREALIEAALFEGAAPLLVVPYITRTALSTSKVMIAWDGSRTAAHAVQAALPILAQAGQIAVVMVGAAMDGPGEPGADIATWLARHGLSVDIETIPAPATGIGDALLNHASDRGFDLLVMGGYGHSRVREFLFGGATRDILRSMTVPILMAH